MSTIPAPRACPHGLLALLLLLAIASAGQAQAVTLVWDANTDGVTAGYAVSYGTSPGNYGVTVDVGNTTSYSLHLLPAQTYYFIIRAYDSLRQFGLPSNEISFPNGAPSMSLDTPGSGVTITQPFLLGGWAIDRAASSGTGVDAIHVYATSQGGSPIFVGVASYSGRRTDVGARLGAQFTNSGYNLMVTSLSPGTYTLVAYAHSTVTGTFNQSRSAVVTIPLSSPVMSVDSPNPGASVGQPFVVGGWAIDRAAGSGTGVSAIHIYAFPNPGSGTPPIFLGAATYGGRRSDVGATFGARFTNSGYNLSVSGLSPGRYQLAVYALSTATGTFNNSSGVEISIPVPVSSPVMSIDTPRSPHPGSSFVIAGWAIDRASSTSPGVDAIHVWAFPVGRSAFFAGTGSYGGARNDVGASFGSRFTNSGYGLLVNGLDPGTYDFVVYARSTVTGTFNQSRVVRVTVP